MVDFDPEALQPTFRYTDDQGRAHEVWMQDAASVAKTMGRNQGLRGAALWALGEEDPASWKVFDRQAAPAITVIPALEHVALTQQIAFTGQGELLNVIDTPHAGARRIAVDPVSGLVSDEVWTRWPSAWTVRRIGAPDRTPDVRRRTRSRVDAPDSGRSEGEGSEGDLLHDRRRGGG